jgi:hypothetical protein
MTSLRGEREEGSAMRTLVRIPVALMLLAVGSGMALAGLTAAAQDFSPWPAPTTKPAPDNQAAPRVPEMHGDTVRDPFLIPRIPHVAAGNTCGFNHDYDHACPYEGSLAKDVVYRYDCGADRAVDIVLCASTYDTKVFVFEDTETNVIACNDDYCSFQSRLINVAFSAGHTYYVVIDGYSAADCGDYVLAIEEYVPCALECPAGAMPEGEPECHENYNDNYNYGCHTPNMFQFLEPSVDPIVICGTSGVFMYDTLMYRDTDWFQIDLPHPANICLSGDAEIPMYFFIIDGRGGCASAEVMAYAQVGPCTPVSDLCYPCGSGTWWLYAAPAFWDLSLSCGSIYVMEITGYTPDPASVPEEGPDQGTGQATTWGRVKGLFR